MEEHANNNEDMLIKYATQSSRILFIENVETWLNFHSIMENYSDTDSLNSSRHTVSYEDSTPQELCNIFLENVLPNIYTRQLTDATKERLKLLELHPQFRRTANGYERITREERLVANFAELPLIEEQESVQQQRVAAQKLRPDVRALQASFQLDKSSLSTTSSSSPPHTLLIKQTERLQRVQLSAVNLAILSACLLQNQELFSFVLLEPAELQRRQRLAKREFENSGEFRVFCYDAKKLVERIAKFKMLRDTLIDVISRRYS